MKKKVLKLLAYIFIASALIGIYFVSPKVTGVIQNCAEWIYELDGNTITRFVELLLSVVTMLAAIFVKEK